MNDYTVEIWTKAVETYDTISLDNLNYGYMEGTISVSFPMTTSSSLPTSYVQKTDVGLGTIYANVSTSSSIRYKDNIENMTNNQALKLLEFRPVTYTYKSDKTNKKQIGLIAEEVAEVDNTTVTYNETGEIEV